MGIGCRRMYHLSMSGLHSDGDLPCPDNILVQPGHISCVPSQALHETKGKGSSRNPEGTRET
jgi:hypothetical protein